MYCNDFNLDNSSSFIKSLLLPAVFVHWKAFGTVLLLWWAIRYNHYCTSIIDNNTRGCVFIWCICTSRFLSIKIRKIKTKLACLLLWKFLCEIPESETRRSNILLFVLFVFFLLPFLRSLVNEVSPVISSLLYRKHYRHDITKKNKSISIKCLTNLLKQRDGRSHLPSVFRLCVKIRSQEQVFNTARTKALIKNIKFQQHVAHWGSSSLWIFWR